MAGDATRLERLLREHEQVLRTERPRTSWFGGLTDEYSAIYRLPAATRQPDARSIIAAHHHFEGWDQFAAFAEALRDGQSAVAQFEAAADAIVAGRACVDVSLIALGRLTGRSRSGTAELVEHTGGNRLGSRGLETRRPPLPCPAKSFVEPLHGSLIDNFRVAGHLARVVQFVRQQHDHRATILDQIDADPEIPLTSWHRDKLQVRVVALTGSVARLDMHDRVALVQACHQAAQRRRAGDAVAQDGAAQSVQRANARVRVQAGGQRCDYERGHPPHVHRSMFRL
jgi:hypothetical protein